MAPSGAIFVYAGEDTSSYFFRLRIDQTSIVTRSPAMRMASATVFPTIPLTSSEQTDRPFLSDRLDARVRAYGNAPLLPPARREYSAGRRPLAHWLSPPISAYREQPLRGGDGALWRAARLLPLNTFSSNTLGVMPCASGSRCSRYASGNIRFNVHTAVDIPDHRVNQHQQLRVLR